jgi:LAGLIDADG-like domain
MSAIQYYTEIEIAGVREFYPDYGIKTCSDKTGIRPSRIMNIVRKYGLSVKKSSYKHIYERRDTRSSEDFDVNPELFTTSITMPEVAYLLGYLWADGYVRVVGKAYILSMCILHKDYIRIRDAMDKIGKWRVYSYRQSSNNKLAVTIRTGNKPLVLWLCEQDYHRKSIVAPTKILSKIPKHLKHYFWRGFFDGDGSIRVSGRANQFYFCGSHTYDWKEHTDLLDRLQIKYSIVKHITKTGRSSTVVCSTRDGVDKFGDYIYAGYAKDKIGLSRKYKRWGVTHERAKTAHDLEAIQISHDDQTLSIDNIFAIIGKHNCLLTLEKIALYLKQPRWKVRDIVRKLIRSNQVDYVNGFHSRPALLCLSAAINTII